MGMLLLSGQVNGLKTHQNKLVSAFFLGNHIPLKKWTSKCLECTYIESLKKHICI